MVLSPLAVSTMAHAPAAPAGRESNITVGTSHPKLHEGNRRLIF
jgi:hypothetical protein